MQTNSCGVKRSLAGLLVSWSLFASSASAQSPVAIVEDIKGNVGDVEFMDYLTPGRVIHLGGNDSVVLSYLKSCWRETIRGGTVIVGEERSEVQSGVVERTKVQCDAGRIQLTPQQANQSAGMVFRAGPTRPGMPHPQFTIHGLAPLIEAKGGGTLVIERLDHGGDRHVFVLRGPALVRGAFYDFASSDERLVAGGIYRASMGSRQIVFRVDPAAKPGRTPVLGRLLRFEPAN